MPFSLKDKVAIITGGNGGIGLGMARGMAQAGANIVVAGRDHGKSLAACSSFNELGIRAEAIEVDVANADSCSELMRKAHDQFGRIDILVNNAGINIRKSPEVISPREWRDVLAINLDGAFYCAHAAHPYIKQQGGGKIINIGSMLSIFGMPMAPAYGASKGGIVQLTKSLATAWAADNIQVNTILPGWIDTALTTKAKADLPGLQDRVLARSPAGRWGKPEDFAGIAVFLASSASDFITGASIPVDGGFSIQG